MAFSVTVLPISSCMSGFFWISWFSSAAAAYGRILSNGSVAWIAATAARAALRCDSLISCANAGEDSARMAEAARSVERRRTRLCNIMVGRTPWFSGGMDGLDAVAAGDDG